MRATTDGTVPNDELPGKPDWFALLGVVVTVLLHLVLQANGPNLVFMVGAFLFWTCFVVIRARRDNDELRRWGFRRDNFRQASVAPTALFVAGALGLGLFAYCQGRFQFPAHTLILFLLYPAWGVAQQFLALGIAVRNLELVPGLGQQRVILALLGATLFAAVHAPDWLVMAATFLLELFVVPMYLRFRNLWPLGVLHGCLGVLFYLWGMGRDMFVENFGYFG